MFEKADDSSPEPFWLSDLFDDPRNAGLDRITRLATKVFHLPMAAVSISYQGRQVFKSRVGFEATSIPQERPLVCR